jgi:apolipoprotein N-acyltransferase
VLVFGASRLTEPFDERVRVALIANDALRGRASGNGPATREVARAYARALRARVAARPGIVVLPEALFTGAEAYGPLADAAAELGAPIVAGFVETLPDGRRVNSARVYVPDADTELYIKRRLIPGLDAGFAVGSGPLVMNDNGVAICKDMDFAPMIREYGARGVRLMLTPAWDFVTDGRLHARMAVVRGVENGFALARTAADGKLTVSDRYGRIVAEAATSRDGFVSLVASVGLKSGGTLYTRIGDAFGWITAAAAAMLLAYGLIVRRGRRAHSPLEPLYGATRGKEP